MKAGNDPVCFLYSQNWVHTVCSVNSFEWGNEMKWQESAQSSGCFSDALYRLAVSKISVKEKAPSFEPSLCGCYSIFQEWWAPRISYLLTGGPVPPSDANEDLALVSRSHSLECLLEVCVHHFRFPFESVSYSSLPLSFSVSLFLSLSLSLCLYLFSHVWLMKPSLIPLGRVASYVRRQERIFRDTGIP